MELKEAERLAADIERRFRKLRAETSDRLELLGGMLDET